MGSGWRNMEFTRTKSFGNSMRDLTKEFQKTTDYYEEQKRALQDEHSARTASKARASQRMYQQTKTSSDNYDEHENSLDPKLTLITGSKSNIRGMKPHESEQHSLGNNDPISPATAQHARQSWRGSGSKIFGASLSNLNKELQITADLVPHVDAFHRAPSSARDEHPVGHGAAGATAQNAQQHWRVGKVKNFGASISNLTRELHATADSVPHIEPSPPNRPQHSAAAGRASPPRRAPPPAAAPPHAHAAQQDRPRGPAPARSFRGIGQLTQELRDSDGRRDRAVRDLLGAPAAPPPHAPPRGAAASLGGGSGSGTFHGAATPRGAAGASLNRTASLHNSKASAAPASLNLNAVPSAVAGPVLAAAGSFRAARAQPLDSPAAGPPDSPPPRRAPGAGPKTGGGGGGGSLAARASRALLRPMRQCLSVPA